MKNWGTLDPARSSKTMCRGVQNKADTVLDAATENASQKSTPKSCQILKNLMFSTIFCSPDPRRHPRPRTTGPHFLGPRELQLYVYYVQYSKPCRRRIFSRARLSAASRLALRITLGHFLLKRLQKTPNNISFIISILTGAPY